MEILAYVLGIFGLVAFLQSSSLKSRIDALEEQLSKVGGTTYHAGRQDLLRAARSYVGQKVSLDLKEDHEDVDVVMYGNTRHGSNTVLDVDDDWMLVRIDTPKGTKTKLIRLGSIEGISQDQEG